VPPFFFGPAARSALLRLCRSGLRGAPERTADCVGGRTGALSKSRSGPGPGNKM